MYEGYVNMLTKTQFQIFYFINLLLILFSQKPSELDYDEKYNDDQKSNWDLIKKIIVWFIVFFVIAMMVLIVIFNPRFYTFVELIKL
jgi:hypothetical protein